MGRRIIRISSDLFQELLPEGKQWTSESELKAIKGLPEGARLVGVSVHYYWDNDDVLLKYEHESWPENDRDQPIPMIEFGREMLSDTPYIV